MAKTAELASLRNQNTLKAAGVGDLETQISEEKSKTVKSFKHCSCVLTQFDSLLYHLCQEDLFLKLLAKDKALEEQKKQTREVQEAAKNVRDASDVLHAQHAEQRARLLAIEAQRDADRLQHTAAEKQIQASLAQRAADLQRIKDQQDRLAKLEDQNGAHQRELRRVRAEADAAERAHGEALEQQKERLRGEQEKTKELKADLRASTSELKKVKHDQDKLERKSEREQRSFESGVSKFVEKQKSDRDGCTEKELVTQIARKMRSLKNELLSFVIGSPDENNMDYTGYIHVSNYFSMNVPPGNLRSDLIKDYGGQDALQKTLITKASSLDPAVLAKVTTKIPRSDSWVSKIDCFLELESIVTSRRRSGKMGNAITKKISMIHDMSFSTMAFSKATRRI